MPRGNLASPTLTGKHRYRTNWRGKMILELQFEGLLTRYVAGHVETEYATGWRDAKARDFVLPGPSPFAKSTTTKGISRG